MEVWYDHRHGQDGLEEWGHVFRCTMIILPQNAFIQAYTKIYTENRTSINYKYGRKFTVVQDRF